MIWALLMSAVVLLVAGLGAGFLVAWRRVDSASDDGPGDGIPLRLGGYRMAQVDEVAARLEAQLARGERRLAELRGFAPPTEPLPAAAAQEEAAITAALAAQAALTADRRDRQRPPRTSRTGPQPWWRARLMAPAPRPRGWADVVALITYAASALWVLGPLAWARGSAHLSQGVQDQQAFEWYFAATAHNVATLSNPFFSNLENYPEGVNLMANAGMLGLGIPLTPITLLAGPFWTFWLVLFLGYVGTAYGWARLFGRRLGVGWPAAALGGWLCAFGPAMISHGNGHPNFVFQVLVPLLLERVLALAETERPVAAGVVLGLLAAWQVFIGEEVLLLAAIGFAIAGLVGVARRRVPVVRMLPGLAVAAGVAFVLVAGPLWWQFFGRQSYASIWHPDTAVNDLAALWGRATRSAFVDPFASAALSMNRTEENAFFGIPLWVAALLVVVFLGVRPSVQALGAVALGGAWLSIGSAPTLHGAPVALPTIQGFVQGLPILENVLTTRWTLLTLPALAGLLAVGLDALASAGWVQSLVRSPAARTAGVLAVGTAVLAPVLPTPLVADPRPPIPPMFTDGTWRQYLHGGSLLVAPPPQIADARAMEWQMAAGMGFPIIEGYFLGPDGGAERAGTYGSPGRPLSLWLRKLDAAKTPIFATPGEQEQFRADLKHWHTDLVVRPSTDTADPARLSLDALVGVGQVVGDVVVWDVRAFRDASS